jgi:poly-gamma-glutamate synthesis protein (capsule biosynthesis protein)
MSMIARLHIAAGRLVESAFLPLWIGRDAVPRVLAASDPRHAQVVDYMRAVTAEAGLNAWYRELEGRVLVEAA